MHTVYIHIDDDIEHTRLCTIQRNLICLDHVTDVEIHAKTPHDVLVEFEEEFITPMQILEALNKEGVRADIMSG